MIQANTEWFQHHFSMLCHWRWQRPPVSQPRALNEEQEQEGVRHGHGPADLSSIYFLLTNSGGCTNRQVVFEVRKVTCNLCFNLVRFYLPPATDALVLTRKQVSTHQNIDLLIIIPNTFTSFYYFLLIVSLPQIAASQSSAAAHMVPAIQFVWPHREADWGTDPGGWRQEGRTYIEI